MEKITYAELERIMLKHNRDHGNYSEPITGVVVFKSDNWDTDYSLESRSYRVSSNNRGFQHGMISRSVFGSSLDGTDIGVRIDWYGWDVDYCYMEGGEK